jgi:hypothetical protein
MPAVTTARLGRWMRAMVDAMSWDPRSLDDIRAD